MFVLSIMCQIWLVDLCLYFVSCEKWVRVLMFHILCKIGLLFCVFLVSNWCIVLCLYFYACVLGLNFLVFVLGLCSVFCVELICCFIFNSICFVSKCFYSWFHLNEVFAFFVLYQIYTFFYICAMFILGFCVCICVFMCVLFLAMSSILHIP